MTIHRYRFTQAERYLLGEALDFSVKFWPHDVAVSRRRETAQWLRSLTRFDRVGMTDDQVRDVASCLGYMAACEEHPTARQRQRELLTKLVAPLGKTLADVDRVLCSAKGHMKASGA